MEERKFILLNDKEMYIKDLSQILLKSIVIAKEMFDKDVLKTNEGKKKYEKYARSGNNYVFSLFLAFVGLNSIVNTNGSSIDDSIADIVRLLLDNKEILDKLCEREVIK